MFSKSENKPGNKFTIVQGEYFEGGKIDIPKLSSNGKWENWKFRELFDQTSNVHTTRAIGHLQTLHYLGTNIPIINPGENQSAAVPHIGRVSAASSAMPPTNTNLYDKWYTPLSLAWSDINILECERSLSFPQVCIYRGHRATNVRQT